MCKCVKGLEVKVFISIILITANDISLFGAWTQGFHIRHYLHTSMRLCTTLSLLICPFIIMSLLGCFAKKEKKINLESWLDERAEGKYVIVEKLINPDPKNLYYKKASAVIALKSDSMVQIKVHYNTSQSDLGLDIDSIRNEFVQAEVDMKVAKKLADELRAKSVQKIAVGVIKPAIYFLPFDEPSPEVRGQYLENILEVLTSNNNEEYSRIWIEFIEDSLHGKEFGEIVPNGYWYRSDNIHDRQKIMSLNFEWSPGIKYEMIEDKWRFNTLSDRSIEYMSDAHQQAQIWAGQHLKEPFYLEGEHGVHFELDGIDFLAMRFAFPYFESKMDPSDPNLESKIKGYVTGIYRIDKKLYSDIKTFKEQ